MESPQKVQITNFSHKCPVDHSGASVTLMGWQCTDANVPPLLFLHEPGDSSAACRADAEMMSSLGMSAYFFDMAGPSRWRDKIYSVGRSALQVLQRDLLQVLALVKHNEKGRAPVVVAFGNAALLAVDISIKYPRLTGGLVLVDPPHAERVAVSALRQNATRLLAEVAPGIELPSRLLAARKVVGASAARTIRSMTPLMAQEWFHAAGGLSQKLTRVDCNCLIIAAGADAVLLWQKTIQALDGAGKRCEVSEAPAIQKANSRIPLQCLSRWLQSIQS